MRIGLFGGSFNPIHAGHLKLAHEALSELNLDRVVFIPSRQNPLKPAADLMPAETRARLVEKAVRRHPRFEVSRSELDRKGLSFTVDTLKYFKRRHPRAVLYFLTGADAAATLPRWKSPEEVKKLCRFVVMTRPGSERTKLPAGTFALPFDALDVSASEIRKRLKNGKSVKGLVPKEIENVIASAAKQSMRRSSQRLLRRFAPRNDEQLIT